MATNIFLHGITDFIILFLLSSQDHYIYEISNMITQQSNGKISISSNTIYSAIYRLEKLGYVSDYAKLVGKRRTRVYYHLEDKGRKHLAELLQKYTTTIDGVTSILNKLSN